ncbi:hypothetical protein [Microbacterium sp. CFBP 8794]|uniref:hypothetical protein n=1 Tax=Microbacterium sp. CFBP 8794 TaxID=2775269 RepID=UPI00177CD87A|nr:hypothetical protein [Microbacterium sp. CFBP 8794]MBD8477588.1 hypothetical protein [Microbacterium sp. CFBP 8794]
MSVVIEAQKPGECESCTYGIRPGQNITPAPNGWEHTQCPQARQVCSVCFIEVAMNGACSCES